MTLISPRPDIFVLGFQEIVPLTAQQIVQTDPEKKRVTYHTVCRLNSDLSMW